MPKVKIGDIFQITPETVITITALPARGSSNPILGCEGLQGGWTTISPLSLRDKNGDYLYSSFEEAMKDLVEPVAKPTLKMREYTIEVLVVRPAYEIILFGGPGTYRETRVITGYTLKDAKQRAGIT